MSLFYDMAKRSKAKGNRGELELCKILSGRFGKPFSRVVGSGNRWGQISNPSADYIGDVVSPRGFRYSVECKLGRDRVHFQGMLGGDPVLNEFFSQCEADSQRAGLEPLLCWKQSRREWLAFVKRLPPDAFGRSATIGQWHCVLLPDLLSLPDSWFFGGEEPRPKTIDTFSEADE